MDGKRLTLVLALSLGLGACAATSESPQEGAVAEAGEYLFKDPISDDRCVRERRTGSRIPRCVDDTAVYGKAYHAPGREIDDRVR